MITPAMYQAVVIKNALKFYMTTKRQVNSAYTPTAMLRTAGNIVGRSFKPREYRAAVEALEEWLREKVQ